MAERDVLFALQLWYIFALPGIPDLNTFKTCLYKESTVDYHQYANPMTNFWFYI